MSDMLTMLEEGGMYKLNGPVIVCQLILPMVILNKGATISEAPRQMKVKMIEHISIILMD